MMLWMSPWKRLSQKRKLMLKTLPKNVNRQQIVEESTRSSDQIYLAILWRMSLLNYLFGCPPEVATSWVMDVDWIMIFIHVLQQEWLKYAADFPDFTPRTINTSTFMVDIPPSGFGRHTDGLCGDWVFLSKFTIAMSLKKKKQKLSQLSKKCPTKKNRSIPSATPPSFMFYKLFGGARSVFFSNVPVHPHLTWGTARYPHRSSALAEPWRVGNPLTTTAKGCQQADGIKSDTIMGMKMLCYLNYLQWTLLIFQERI